MTELARRRRVMMAQKSGGKIPAGYVTDGLVFFLDGLQQADANSWTDIVGGKTFTLTDCAVNGGGVVFNGSTSKGLFDGSITSDWTQETVEAAYALGSGNVARGILCQPYASSVGISMVLGAHDRGNRNVIIGLDGASHIVKWATATAKVLSACDGLCIANRDVVSDTQTSGSTKNETGSTILGARIIGTNSPSAFFSGTIYAVRIYNRKLTEAEMMQNQQADIDRYGITI